MGDRRPSSSSAAFSFRFWPGRRTPATQTPSPPATTNSAPTTAPATTNPAPTTTPTAESQATSRQSNTTAPPTAETQNPSSQSTTIASSPPNPTTPTDPKPNPTTPPPSDVQTASQPATTTLTSPEDEPKNSSPSSTKSPSPSKPTSPSRRTAQSRSPPHPSSPAKSPSRVAPQARSIRSSSPSQMGSKTPTTPQRAPQPRSPSRLNSRSPKQTSPNSSPKDTHPTSPSKESRETNQDISTSLEAQTLASNEKDPKPVMPSMVKSQQETQLKAEVKSDSVDDFNGVDDGTNFKHNEVKLMPSKSSKLGTTTTTTQSPDKPTPTEKLDASSINGGNEPLEAMPEEKKDVKEVVQATKTEANEVTKKEVNDFLAPKSGSEEPIIEKSEISRKPDEVHTEKQEVLDRNENVATSLPSVKPTNTTTSQPKKRSTTPGTHSKSVRASGEHVSLNKDIMDDISKIVNKTAIGGTKNAIYDRHVSIITLAGENRGASMQMGSNSSKGVHIHRGCKIKPDENAEATTDGEGSFKGKQSEDAKATEDQPTEAYVNKNAQGINNSIVFNASIAERNPGVHMAVTHVPKEPIRSTEKTSPLETRKAEFNMSRAEKLTYEPTVRRRCLKGLLLETSDSDPENPEKPRRHGCRVGCPRKEKENDIDVL